MTKNQIQQWIVSQVDKTLARPTRCHALPAYLEASLFIKREDELSSGIAGSKIRKYASLLPFLKSRGVTEVALIGGPNSNNLVGLLQILKEAKIKPWLFIRKAADQELRGNALFLDMLAPVDSTFYIERSQWQDAQNTAQNHLSKREQSGVTTFLIPEGALCFESLAGSITLAIDLLRDESEHGTLFHNLYIDSGTGMSAIGLLLGLSLLDENRAKRKVHISLIAGDSKEFSAHLARFERQLKQSLSLDSLDLPAYDFLEPPTAKKFGAVNETLFSNCRRIAKEHGILMDPAYSVKHYMAMEEHRKGMQSNGSNSLFIFNGGALGLAGFQGQLAR